MSLLERDDAPRDTKALPTVTHIGWAQFARAAMTNARGGQSGFRNFMVPWLLSPEHMYVTNGFDALRAYVADNPHAWTDESGSPIAFPAKPNQSDAEKKAAMQEKVACELFVKKIMHTGFKLCAAQPFPFRAQRGCPIGGSAGACGGSTRSTCPSSRSTRMRTACTSSGCSTTWTSTSSSPTWTTFRSATPFASTSRTTDTA